ncbi:MAG: hypothetical protein HOG05_16690, partial [Bacteroidetes bacterium]|nr:hypothetical protein [Bacteroidota bacterium]
GMEKDDEIRGAGLSYNFGARSIYDGRLARFISVDPDFSKYPYASPYAYALNCPISFIDYDGRGIIPGLKEWGFRNGYSAGLFAGIMDSYAEGTKFALELYKYIPAAQIAGPYGFIGMAVLDYRRTKELRKNIVAIATDSELRGNAVDMIEGALGNYIKEFTGLEGSGAQGYAHGTLIWTAAESALGGGAFLKAIKAGKFSLNQVKQIKLAALSSIVGVSEGTTALNRIARRTAGFINKIEWHHVIPKNLKSNLVVKAAIRKGFDFEGKLANKIPLEKYLYKNGSGTHGHSPKYDAQVLDEIENFSKLNPNFTDKDAYDFLNSTYNDIIKVIDENPKVKLNDLNLNL